MTYHLEGGTVLNACNLESEAGQSQNDSKPLKATRNREPGPGGPCVRGGQPRASRLPGACAVFTFQRCPFEVFPLVCVPFRDVP